MKKTKTIHKTLIGNNDKTIVIYTGRMMHLLMAQIKSAGYMLKLKEEFDEDIPEGANLDMAAGTVTSMFLLQELIEIDGKQLTFDEIENLHLSDWTVVTQHISEMLLSK